MRNTPSIIFSDLLESALRLEICLSMRCSENVFWDEKCSKKFMFPENDMKSSFDSVDQNFDQLTQKTALICFFEVDFNELLNGLPTAGGRPTLCCRKQHQRSK